MKKRLQYGIILLIFFYEAGFSQSLVHPQGERMRAKSYGVPASPQSFTLEQPDGKPITLYIRGDGAVHWYETPDGYTVMRNQEGTFEYALYNNKKDMVLSGIPARNREVRPRAQQLYLSQIPQGVFYSSKQITQLRNNYLPDTKGAKSGSFPSTGTNKLLVLLMDFPDNNFSFPSENFDNLMNQENYIGKGSFHDYYMAQSYNQLDIITTIRGWYTAPQNHDYYCDECPGANPNLTYRQFVRAAVDAAEADGVDFSEYDNDGDGNIDGLTVIHAGDGAELGNNTNIWSHSWDLGPLAVNYDGITISNYTLNPETTYGAMGTIGVLCHEFGHNLGIPDFYDADYTTNGQGFDLGEWDCMASGSYNGFPSGSNPAGHNAWSRSYLEWMELTEISEPGSYTLNNLTENGEAYYYTTATNDEFFMLENRQKINGTFSQNLPGHGMLIYHIDLNWTGWNNNRVNATASHQAMDIEEADNQQTYGSVAGDAYPGTSNITSFTDETTPGSIAWNGTTTNKPITNIAEAGTIITFNFMGGNANEPINLTGISYGADNITLNWQLSQNNLDVILVSHTNETIGTPVPGTTYTVGDILPGGGTVRYLGAGTTYQHEELMPATTYYYKLFSILDAGPSYSSGITTSVTTQCEAITTLPASETFANSTVIPTCWSIMDYMGNNQVWQFGFIPNLDLNSTTGNDGYAYLYSNGYGLGSEQNTDLISPAYDLTDATQVTLNFEHFYLHMTGCSATLDYSIDNGLSWITLQQWVTTQNNSTPVSLDITSEAGNQSSVMFRWNYTGSKGVWALDDILLEALYIDVEDATLSEISANGIPLENFDPATLHYTLQLNEEDPDIPIITATTTVEQATLVITPAASIPGITHMEVTAVNGTTTLDYTVEISNVYGLTNLSTAGISIYPVPANGYIQLSSTKSLTHVTIAISNSNGQLIMTKKYDQLHNGQLETLDTSTFPSGIYYINIHSNQINSIGRFIKN